MTKTNNKELIYAFIIGVFLIMCGVFVSNDIIKIKNSCEKTYGVKLCFEHYNDVEEIACYNTCSPNKYYYKHTKGGFFSNDNYACACGLNTTKVPQ